MRIKRNDMLKLARHSNLNLSNASYTRPLIQEKKAKLISDGWTEQTGQTEVSWFMPYIDSFNFCGIFWRDEGAIICYN